MVFSSTAASRSEPGATQTRFRAADGCYECELGTGMAILDTRSDRYFTLNGVGRFIWMQLAEPVTCDEIVARTADAFEVDPARCRADVDRLIARLQEQNLVETA